MRDPQQPIMTESNRRFTTDSSPGEQNFERTANDATTYIAELLTSESEYWGPRMHAIVGTGVRAILRADETVTAGSVERTIQNDELRERFGIGNQTEVLERFDNMLRGSSENGEIDHD